MNLGLGMFKVKLCSWNYFQRVFSSYWTEVFRVVTIVLIELNLKS